MYVLQAEGYWATSKVPVAKDCGHRDVNREVKQVAILFCQTGFG